MTSNDNTILIENLVKIAMTYYSSLTKLDGVKNVCTFRATESLQLYIICDNGDIIQIIYLYGTNRIYATLVGMHCSNDVSLPVCRDEYAREELIYKLRDETLYPFMSSTRLDQCAVFSYPFWRRGHIVYYLKLCSADVRRVKYTFSGLVKDVLRKHKDGTLLSVAKLPINLAPEEITEEWVLC